MQALYGCLRSALLLYNQLVADLDSMEFELNQYDICVVNNTIKEEQFNVVYTVDDFKVSHKDPKEVTKFL